MTQVLVSTYLRLLYSLLNMLDDIDEFRNLGPVSECVEAVRYNLLVDKKNTLCAMVPIAIILAISVVSTTVGILALFGFIKI